MAKLLPVWLLALSSAATDEEAANKQRRPPPTFVPIDFVPEFTFTARVVALDPPPTDIKNVRNIMEWGWGQRAGETSGFEPSQPCNFTRNKTGHKWATSYPNTYGLRPQYFQGRKESEDEYLVTHLFFCHIGTEPSHNASLRAPNQTTTVEVNFTLDREELSVGGTLEWGGDEGYCDDLGIIMGRRKSTGKHFVETFQQYNTRRYSPAFEALPAIKTPIKKFPIQDGFRTSDGSLNAKRDLLRHAKRMGIHGVLGGGDAWLTQEELGYKLTSVGGEVGDFEWKTCVSRSRSGLNLLLACCLLTKSASFLPQV